MEESIVFEADGFLIKGHLHLPEKTGAPVVVGAHGLLSTGDSPKQQALAKRLNNRGIAYLRFDHRGCGGSQGVFPQVTSFKGRCSDLHAAVEYVRTHQAIGSRIGLFGSSMGGAACLGIAGDLKIDTIVTLAAPIRFDSIQVPLEIDTNPAFCGMDPEQMLFDISEHLESISDILIIHGDSDRIVPFDNGREIFNKVQEPKEFLWLKGADHILSDPVHQDKFMAKTVEWFAGRLIESA